MFPFTFIYFTSTYRLPLQMILLTDESNYARRSVILLKYRYPYRQQQTHIHEIALSDKYWDFVMWSDSRVQQYLRQQKYQEAANSSPFWPNFGRKGVHFPDCSCRSSSPSQGYIVQFQFLWRFFVAHDQSRFYTKWVRDIRQNLKNMKMKTSLGCLRNLTIVNNKHKC